MPPYNAGFIVGETRRPIRGHVDNAELVDVGLDPSGAIRSVAVEQRLTVQGLGDFVLNIPAPGSSIRRLPESQSDPGIRRFSVVWQGFSPGRKVLAARVALRVPEIVGLVPLRLSVERSRQNGLYELDVRVRDVARGSTTTFGGRANAIEVVQKLDAAYAALRRGRKPEAATVSIRGSLQPQVTAVTAAFVVGAEVTVPGRFTSVRATGAHVVSRSPLRLRFGGTVRREAPVLRMHVRARGVPAGTPRARVVARPAAAAVLLAPPGGRSWTSALRRGLVPRDGKRMLALAVRRLTSAAFTHQYRAFLASPDLAAPSATTYVFRTVAAPRAAPAPAPGGGGNAALTAAGIAIAVVAAAGVVVWWAHS